MREEDGDDLCCTPEERGLRKVGENKEDGGTVCL